MASIKNSYKRGQSFVHVQTQHRIIYSNRLKPVKCSSNRQMPLNARRAVDSPSNARRLIELSNARWTLGESWEARRMLVELSTRRMPRLIASCSHLVFQVALPVRSFRRLTYSLYSMTTIIAVYWMNDEFFLFFVIVLVLTIVIWWLYLAGWPPRKTIRVSDSLVIYGTLNNLLCIVLFMLQIIGLSKHPVHTQTTLFYIIIINCEWVWDSKYCMSHVFSFKYERKIANLPAMSVQCVFRFYHRLRFFFWDWK